MKNNVLCLMAGLLFCLVGAACHRNDIRTLVVSVPDMNSEACLPFIIQAFAPGGMPLEGVLDIKPDVPARTLTFTYDSRRIAIRNLEYAITKAGFSANEHPAREDAQRRLPPECRPQSP